MSRTTVKCPRCQHFTYLKPPAVECTGLVRGYQSRHCVVCKWQQWECVPASSPLNGRTE
jgi:hypothetical protein